MKDISRLAVVNRGEAAMRALHAVAEYNHEHDTDITTIALATTPDRRAWFAREADEVVDIGPAMVTAPDGTRSHAYVDIDLLERVLTAHDVDAVWAGWGFVAERADFAAMCERNGITFIGPTSDTIRRLGDKVEAKRIAEAAGVPVVPWSGGVVEDLDEARAAAEHMGYPLLVKAAAGGGGRGIRRAQRPEELADAVTGARAEAAQAFGDPTVFLEQVVAAARHIEIQVVADQHGTVWAVGTRDCTVQRRNQKVLEESASTALSAEQDQALRDAGAAICAEAGYHGAGTVEFLWDQDAERAYFMEVNTRLQVEHPVTEVTTGLDLVKLQLDVARGRQLRGEPPTARGHAIEARLNAEDPARGFAPAPGHVAHLRLANGPGVRIDAGITQGDDITAEFDSMVAKVIAWGADRDEAIARLRRALAETVAVIEGGTTNKAFLLALLGRPELRDGDVHTRWLDQLTTAGEHMPEHDGACLVAAAIEAYDVEHAAARASFLAAAARGRPEVRDEIGHTIELRFQGETYRFAVLRTGEDDYRVELDDGRTVDAEMTRRSGYERRLRLDGRTLRIVADVQGPTYQIEVDGIPHRMERDDGGFVRSPAPAAVIRLLVGVGETLEVGTPVAVLESMKMESTVTAPFAGTVRDVLVAAHDQVDANAPLLRIAAATDGAQEAGDTWRIDLDVPGARTRAAAADPLAAARSLLLGYDLDAATIDALRRGALRDVGPDGQVHHEIDLLRLFADIGELARRQPRTELDDEVLEATSPREHMIAYLRSIDRGDEQVPSAFVDRLLRALRHYGVTSLDRTPELDEALHWLYRALDRMDLAATVAGTMLDRWLEDGLAGEAAADELRVLTDRLVRATEHRHPTVADLARSVRFQFVERPVLETARAEVYARMDTLLDELEATSDPSARAALLDELVSCPLPLRPRLLPRHLADERAAQETALQVRTRRYYRTRDLAPIGVHEHQGVLFAQTQYSHEGLDVRLAVTATSDDGLDQTLAAAADLANDLPEDRAFVLDVAVRSTAPMPRVEALAEDVAARLAAAGFDHPVHRVDTTVSYAGEGSAAQGTLHVTHRGTDEGGFEEEVVYRNMHPMLAKRIGLWRLSHFALERLDSAEDVYLFRGTAHDNPDDVRLFAIAEVRDLTPIEQDGRIVALPLLERQLHEALSAIRSHEAHMPPRQRPVNNRIVLYVRPALTVPSTAWRDLAHRLAPATAGLGLEKVVVRARIPHADTGELEDVVLHIENVGRRGVVVRRGELGDEPIRTLTPYRQRVLKTERHGSVYPYELVRMLTPSQEAEADFPPGSFQEYDLDGDRLVAVDRPWGQNRANLVVGVITNHTATVPEGMRRVIVLGDPSRSLGSLAEAECRRINAALDLAEEQQLPLEWFAVSSGARIATDTGTENMDWIGAVLRRLIEFTQAGGEVNIVVTGINVGAQPYWNAEATMLMHTKGILVMTPQSAMVLTGKQALDFSGGVSAEDNLGIGGYERIMGPNGQGQYWAPTLEHACGVLFQHYAHTYVVPGERFPRPADTSDPYDRDVRDHPHAAVGGSDFTKVGDIFSAERNPERKKPFDIRSVMHAVRDQDSEPLERWHAMRDADTVVVWDARVGGTPVCMLGIESHPVPRAGVAPADGPGAWTSGTLFPQSSKKLARALNAASGNRPVVVMANLSGFDGSPESMRKLQLEFGAEIGRAVTNFDGPIVFVVVSRYHGGAFVVFSKTLNEHLEIAAVEGSHASVIGGTPAAAVVFAREVRTRTHADPRVVAARAAVEEADEDEVAAHREELAATIDAVHSEKVGEMAAEFDGIHTIERAARMGSVDEIIAAADLRPWVIGALERGMARVMEE